MRRSGKNGQRAEHIRRDVKKLAKVEPLRPQAEQLGKFNNDIAKFPQENPHPVLRIHKDGTVLYANRVSEPLLKAKGSGVGLPAPAEWRRLAKEVLASGRMAREEVEFNGHIFEFLAVPIAGTDYVNFYGDEITERKQAEQALKKSNQLLRDTGEMAKVGGWELDLSTREVLWTEEVARIHGLDPGHKISLEEALNFYAPESRPALEAVLKKAAETAEPYDLESLFIPSGSKDKIWVRSLGRAVYSGGKIVKLAGTFQSIDKYKRAEETLRETTQTLQAVIQASPLPIFAVDRERIVKTWNPAAERIFGWSAQEAIGRQYPAIPKEKMDEADDLFSRAMESGLTEVETLRQRKDGSLIDVSISAAPLRDSRGNINGVMAVLTDITERKRAEQELLEDRKQLKQLTSQLALTEERERRRIAGELHDQISQSLALAKIKLDALRASGKSEPVEQDLTEVSDTLQRLIDQTRSLVFDISSPILYELGFEAAVAEWLSEQVQDKYGIAAEFQDDGLPKSLDDDVKVLLFRNVRELLINAIKYAHAGKVNVSIRRIDDSIEITVRDNGIGFDTEQAKAMAPKSGKFGLFSIWESLEQLGGHFEIESKPGAGCTATIVAPLKRKGIAYERNRAAHQKNGN